MKCPVGLAYVTFTLDLEFWEAAQAVAVSVRHVQAECIQIHLVGMNHNLSIVLHRVPRVRLFVLNLGRQCIAFLP